MPIRETLKLFWSYCRHEVSIIRTPLGLTALIIAIFLSLCGVVLFIAYGGNIQDLFQGFGVEMFGVAVVFMTVELIWPTFIENYRREYGTEDLPYHQELQSLRDEVQALRELLEERLPIETEQN